MTYDNDNFNDTPDDSLSADSEYNTDESQKPVIFKSASLRMDKTSKNPSRRAFLKNTAIGTAGTLALTGCGDDDKKRSRQQGSSCTRQIFYSDSAPVRAVAFSPGATHACAGGDSGVARVWNVQTGEVTLTFWNHGSLNRITAMEFSPDGSYIVSTSIYRMVLVWDSSTGVELTRYTGHPASVNCVAISPDGTRVATGDSANAVHVWDFATGNHIYTHEGHTGPVSSVKFHPDGNLVISSSNVQEIQAWNPDTGEVLLQNIYSPSSTTVPLTAGTQTSTISIAGTGNTVNNDFRIDMYLVYPVTTDLVIDLTSHAGTTVRLWNQGNVNFGNISGTFPTTLTPAESLDAFIGESLDGDWTLTISGHNEALNGILNSWAITMIFMEGFRDLALSSSGDLVYIATQDNANSTVKAWDTATGELARTIYLGAANGIHTIALSPNDTTLAVAQADSTVSLWNINTSALIASYDEHTSIVSHMAFSPDGSQLLLGGSDRYVDIIDATTGQNVVMLLDPAQVVNQFVACGSGGNGGSACTCDTVCSCDSVCTCNTVCTCNSQGGGGGGGGGGHYWYPN